MSNYEPTEWAKTRKLWSCEGLPEIVADAAEIGFTCAVDLGCDEEEWQIVTPETAVMAVNEVDEAILRFCKDGEKTVGVLVIPGNGDDWLCDYIHEVRKEAIQTAAMALRFVMSLDKYRYGGCEQHHQGA